MFSFYSKETILHANVRNLYLIMSLYSYYFSSIPLKYYLTGSFSSISCGRNFFQFMSYSSKISAFSRNRTFAGLTAQKPSEALTAQGLAYGFSPTPNVSQIHKAHELPQIGH